MTSQTAIVSHDLLQIDNVSIGIHGMSSAYDASIALSFRDASSVTGLSVGFHGTTEDMRKLAAELIRHADVTDAAQIEASRHD